MILNVDTVVAGLGISLAASDRFEPKVGGCSGSVEWNWVLT